MNDDQKYDIDVDRSDEVRLRVALTRTRDALVDLCVYWGGAHDIECPEDDTCECSQKPFNDRMQAAIDHANKVLGDQP